MFSLVWNLMLLGGSVAFYGLLLLPAVFLLVVSAIYIVFDTIHDFRKRDW